METTLDKVDFGRKKSPFLLILILVAIAIAFSIILRIEAGTKYSAKITQEFKNCQEDNGISEIYFMPDRKFLRTCIDDTGGIIAQILYKIGKDWFLKNTSVADDISDFRHLQQLYPNNELPGYFEEIINELLNFKIVR